MPQITASKVREIIEDFANEISGSKDKGSKPATAVIDFRDDIVNQRERDVWIVRAELLRYRKDNGRIASDVLSYEKQHGPLSETSEEDQKQIAEFLKRKDPEKTAELINSLRARNQIEPAIITCDGFLINGNRRKLALTELYGRDAKMRVVILPGKNEPGGPPTLREIEQIENRYQLQTDGKSEYYNFDRALSIKRKMSQAIGMTLDEQLKDDPNFFSLDKNAFERQKKKIISDLLEPLGCVDEYLSYLNRDELYDTVSTGVGDSEGRWQAFVDYYKSIGSKLQDPAKLPALGISEDEVGNLKDVAFKLIRKRNIKDAPKVHMIMRDLPKLLADERSKKELFQLNKVPLSLPKEFLEDNPDADYRHIDRSWSKYTETDFARHVNVSYDYLGRKIEEDTPLNLLRAALDKLNHEKMNLAQIEISRLKEAMQYSKSITDRSKEIEHDLFKLEKNKESLNGRKS